MAGDFNGDGCDDLVVGAAGFSSGNRRLTASSNQNPVAEYATLVIKSF